MEGAAVYYCAMAISLHEALCITEEPRPFHIKWVGYDDSRNRGGDVMEMEDAIRVGASHNRKENETIVVKKKGSDLHPHTIHNHLIMEVNNQPVFI